MNRRMAVALLICLGIAGSWSCAKERPAKEPAKPGVTNEAAADAPEIPIDVMPTVIDAPVVYPEEARSRGEEGLVLVKALVGKDGKVTEAMVDPKQPASAVLGNAAVAAVKQWSFEPAKTKGKPVAIWIAVPVNFKLH
jgi:periplasmic protein TonB